jgi:hypothetical protein
MTSLFVAEYIPEGCFRIQIHQTDAIRSFIGVVVRREPIASRPYGQQGEIGPVRGSGGGQHRSCVSGFDFEATAAPIADVSVVYASRGEQGLRGSTPP